MAAISNSALANILAKYQARFRPDPQTESMLYHSSERAIPARLSYEQYHEYVTEFETFLITSKRKLMMQAALIFLLAIVLPIAPTGSKYIALLCVVFLGSIYVWSRKARAHKADDEIHARQRSRLG